MEGAEASAADRRPKKEAAPPAGDTGTHWTGPNEYLLAQVTRVRFVTAKRQPFASNAENLAIQLQRFVHYEGNRPPNRKILMHLRLLTYYPPVADIAPELTTLLESDNVHVCRLAHYHLRQMAPLLCDPALMRDIFEALEREALKPSAARRAASTKTFAKIMRQSDAARAVEFVSNVFETIGGARVEDPNKVTQRSVAGVGVPGTDLSKKKSRNGLLDGGKVVSATTQDEADRRDKKQRQEIDDGAGGVVFTTTANTQNLKSKEGKMLAGHAVFAGLRRINRVAKEHAKVESYFFDSGLLSLVPSTVRHCMALLEIRSTLSPGAVSRYLVRRLPHKNPPANMRLHLQDLGARVYYARLLGALAEDPDLDVYAPQEEPERGQAATTGPTLQEALGEKTVKDKARGLFKFLFNKDRVTEIKGAVKTTSNAVSTAVGVGRPNRLPRNDPLGVEFAEGLVNLLKNASNRVLIEALRGLARRKWTTWFEAPVPLAALYNSPELGDGTGNGAADEPWDEEDEGLDAIDEDPDELGAFEDDFGVEEREESNATSPAARKNSGTKRNSDANGAASPKSAANGEEVSEEAAEKQTWFSRLRSDRKQRRVERIDGDTPFYLRKLGAGVVPALEVVLRRIYAALLHDAPIRRFAAADAAVALARAKMYGHVEEDHRKHRQAQSLYRKYSASVGASASREVAIAPSTNGAVVVGAAPGTFDEGETHPLEALVQPLVEIIAEDLNQYVRGRAAVALAFLLGSGAGRMGGGGGTSAMGKSGSFDDDGDGVDKSAVMLRYFGGYVRHAEAGRGVGFRLVGEFVDYLVYEVLDMAPDLAPSSVQLVELWAMTHPTVGVCGRLGAIWEKVLSIGQGAVVGASIFRAVESPPERERVASAATAFLRRRTLDLAVLTVGASHLAGFAVPEPLPRAIGVEMEKYFSLLWHCALLGPSAECRTFAVQALGSAAALGGDPFRVCTYERLVELVRVRGLGLKAAAESALACLDMLYSARERFSEARAMNNVPRDGSCVANQWLQVVWRLAAEACAAAQILIGAPPPPGWQPLGPGGAADLANAERRLGPVGERVADGEEKETPVGLSEGAPVEIAQLRIEGAREWRNERKEPAAAPMGYTASGFDDATRGARHHHHHHAREESPPRYSVDEVDYDDGGRGRAGPSRYEGRSRSPSGARRYDERSRENSDAYARRGGRHSDALGRGDARERDYSDAPRRGGGRETDHELGRSDRKVDAQVEDDAALAARLQAEEERKIAPPGEALRNAAANAPVVAGKLFQGLKRGLGGSSKAAAVAVKGMQEKSKR